jgi:hypothetical protein
VTNTLIPLSDAVAPFAPIVTRPINNITPFTYRDGETFLAMFYRLRSYVIDLGGYVDETLADALAAVDEAIAANQAWTIEQINELTEYVNNAVEQIINSSIVVQDPVVAGLLNNPASQTRIAADALYVDQAELTAINSQFTVINGKITAIESTLNGRLSVAELDKKYLDYVSAKAYGAVADGVTDSAPGINAALAAAKTVFLPAGTYAIKSPIKLNTGNRLLGAGRAQTIIKAHIDMLPEYNLIQSNNISNVAHANYITDIEVSDLTVDGIAYTRPFTTLLGENGCNIRFSTVKNARIKNVHTVNAYQHCIAIDASVYFNDGNPNHQPLGQSEHVVISDITGGNSLIEDGITTHNSHHITISNVMMTHPGALYSTGISNGIEIDDGSQFVTVRDCYINGWNAGYQAKGHTGAYPANNVIFENCIADACTISFSIQTTDPSTLAGGIIPEGKNIFLDRCASYNTVNRLDATQNMAAYIAGYDGVTITNFRAKGGTQNYVSLTNGADNVSIDGFYAENVLSVPVDADRGYIHAFAAYGFTDNQVSIKRVSVFGPALTNPIIRVSDLTTMTMIDDVSGTGNSATNPAVFLGTAKGSYARNIKATGFAGNLDGWIPYSALPQTNFTLGNGTLTASYDTDGVNVDVRIELLLGSTTAFASDFNPRLPIACKYSTTMIAQWFALDASASGAAARKTGIGYSTASRAIIAMFDTAGNSLGTALPFVWATGDRISIIARYERE